MKTKVFFVFLLMTVAVTVFAREEVSEFVVDADGRFSREYPALEAEHNDVYKEQQEVEAPKKQVKARTTVTFSLFYPHYMGSAVKFVEDYAFDPNYGGTPVASRGNMGADAEVRIVVKKYMLVGFGLSWGGTFLFDDNNGGMFDEAGSSMKVVTARALLGGIYPITPWVSFFGGVQGGYLQMLESGYLKAINSHFDEVALPCGMVAPFCGFDFILSGFCISIKADFTAAFSSSHNLLNRNRIETILYPAIYVGCGLAF